MDFLSGNTNSILQEDIEQTANSGILDSIAEKSVIFVTGATGLIGSQVVKSIAYFSQVKGKQLKVIALVRNFEKAKQVFGNMLKSSCIDICVGDITDPIIIPQNIDYIIHGASATASSYFVEKPVETIFTVLRGTANVLELAREKKVKKVVFLSSLEVYGTPDEKLQYIEENNFGHLDPMQVRSSYSEGKRMAECLCASYAKEYNVPVTVARLSQTFGAGVDYHDTRVFAEFARCAIEGHDIVLHTQGNTIRSYCYTSDAVNAIFVLMLRGQVGEAYNVTNMDTAISIKEMAQLVCDLVPEKNLCVKFDIPEDVSAFGYNPEMVIRLDSSKLCDLGWKVSVGLNEMFIRLIKSMIQTSQIKITRDSR